VMPPSFGRRRWFRAVKCRARTTSPKSLGWRHQALCQ
jgi:hypothetical protein